MTFGVPRRRLAAGLALAALGAVLAGCGVSGTIDPVASAATKSENAGAARMTFSATISSPSLAAGKDLTMTGSGVVAHDEAAMTLDMSQLLQQSGAPAGTDGTAKEVYLTQGGDSIIYMEMGMLGKLPGGKHWIEINLSKAGRSLGVDFSKLMSGPTATNPAEMLSMLKATSGQVDNLGSETIDGDVTTHYRATVDLAKAAKLRGISSGALQQLTGQGVPTQVPEDVWIGSDGLVRQFRMSYATTTNNAPVTTTMTIGLSDYGTAVTVTAPSADDVFDATDLATQGIKQQSTTASP